MRAPTAIDFTAESHKPSHRHDHLPRPKLLMTGLFIAALALPITGLSAQEAAQSPAPETTSDSAITDSGTLGLVPESTSSASTPSAAADAPAAGSAEATAADAPSAEAAEPATPDSDASDSGAGGSVEPVSADSPAAENAEAPAPGGDLSDGSAADPAAPEVSAGEAAASGLQATEAAAAQTSAAQVPAEATPAPAAPQNLLDNLSRLLETPEADSETGPDLSPIGMFRGADIVVKLVMLGLVFASLITWTIWFSKSVEIAGAVRRARRVLQIVDGAASMAEAAERAGDKGGPAADMLRAVKAEAKFSEPVVDHVDGAGLKERVTSVLDQISARAGRRAAVGTGILATIGSTAPFVGLFGTVWGIMNAFIGISEAQTSSLAVVAPGIAEALLATALGLVAAIPAVIIYNACARWITGYRHILSEVAAGVERLISRDLDFRHIPAERRLDARAAE